MIRDKDKEKNQQLTNTTMVSIVRLGGYRETNNDIANHTINFRKALKSYFENSTSKNTCVNINKNGDNNPPLLEIRNKYFTALVCIQLSVSSCDNMDTTTNIDKVDDNSSISIEDGIILIFPLVQPSSFDSLQSAHDEAALKNQCGETLRLCVGVCYNSTPTTTTEEEYSRRVLWCLDNGYEYIEADISSDGIWKGHEEREKENFARVIEAMEGTIWSSAIKHPKPSRNVTNSSQVNTATTSCPTNTTDKDQETELKQAKPTTKAEKLQPLEQQQLLPKEEEEIFDNLESVLQEAKKIRENSKEGVLSDDERRQKASDTAFKLMNLLNIMEDDSDDGDDDG